MKTTIYLDVDGVLNAVSVKHPRMAGWTEWETKKVNGWQILFAPKLIEAFNELAKNPNVTIKWLTTWEEKAAQDLSPAIGIEGREWEVLHGYQSRWSGRDWWKFDAIRKDVEATSPEQFIWIDDDLSNEREAIEWATDRGALLISPSTFTGVTVEDLASIISHVYGVNTTTEAIA